MMPDPDPLDGTVEPDPAFYATEAGRKLVREFRKSARGIHPPVSVFALRMVETWVPQIEAQATFLGGRSSFRWYLLASFVTGLLLGAAVARL